jgi:hypothetical protein
MADRLNTGERLTRGQRLTSANGRYHLLMQEDGNVVEYDGAPRLVNGRWTGTVRWATGTRSSSGVLLMQEDGNLVMYDGAPRLVNGRWSGAAKWSSGSRGNGCMLLLQDDGNPVVYQGAPRLDPKNSRWVGDAQWARFGYAAPKSGGFLDTLVDVVKAVPAIAVAPIVAPTLAIASVAKGVATGGSVTELATDVAKYSATHPLETIAITAGGAAVAFGGAVALAPVLGAGGVTAGQVAAAAGAAGTAAGAAAKVDSALGDPLGIAHTGSSSPATTSTLPPAPLVTPERWETFAEWRARVLG